MTWLMLLIALGVAAVPASAQDWAKARLEKSPRHREYVKVKHDSRYEGAGHGFMRAWEAPDASEANKKARDAGWKRMIEVLKSK